MVPTMSRWGLVVMSLMLLLAGGFATRRMMA
ncbi:MAG: IPTL-CTERM sorting domain-containing protein [Wenzhouxiangellaceae bacterium]|nr:IPTL-CTERM sorting domain-containing protein [Wenzhouxiangellaceae bacterium]